MDDLSYSIQGSETMTVKLVAVLTLMDDLSYRCRWLKATDSAVAVLTLMDDLSYMSSSRG